MAGSLQTPPPMSDPSDECYPEGPASPLNEESVNLLLGPPMEDNESIVTIKDLDVEIVDEIYNSNSQKEAEAEEENQEIPPPPPPSPSAGEPTKDSHPPPSPTETTPTFVEDTFTPKRPCSEEILPKLRPVLFSWAECVEDPKRWIRKSLAGKTFLQDLLCLRPSKRISKQH